MSELGIEQNFKRRQRTSKIYCGFCVIAIFLLSVQGYIYLDRQIKDDLFSEILFFVTITIINGSFAVNILQFQMILAVLTVRFAALNNHTRYIHVYM